MQQLSWGYLLERAACLGRPLTAALSRHWLQVQQLSWGYLLERAACLGRPLTAALSRLPGSERASRSAAESDVYGSETTSEIRLAGRVVLNVWRLLRPEVSWSMGCRGGRLGQTAKVMILYFVS